MAPIEGPARTSGWADDNLSAARSAEQWLATMTFAEKVALALGDYGAVAHRGVPALQFADGPNGVRGAEGSTAFPCGLSVAATFDVDLAEAFGAAIADEVRDSGHNVWLGPALDIARVPVAGRLAEALGEDPVLAGRLGSAIVRGSRNGSVVAVAKHYLGNNFEIGRTGTLLPGGRTDAVDVRISEVAIREVYLPPFLAAIEAGACALMGSYNRLNGEYACQNHWLIDLAKEERNWPGCVVPDFLFAVRNPVAAALAGVDIPGLDETGGRTADQFVSGEIPDDRLDDICRRMLWLIIAGGLVDRPLAANAGLGTSAHLDVGTRIATDGIVLLGNSGILPLDSSVSSIAVIGPARGDAQFVIGGSASVAIPDARRSSPLDAIRERAGRQVHVAFAQGTAGDVLLPPIPADAWAEVDQRAGAQGAQRGLIAEYWAGSDRDGEPLLRRIEAGLDITGTPELMPDAWCARWTGVLVPRLDGVHRFSMALAGVAHITIDDTEIALGSREAVSFMGPPCPVTGTADLRAGVPVRVTVTYETGAAITAPDIGMVGPTIRLGWLEPDDGVARACELAARSDVAVVFASFASGEGMDRSGLSLPGGQDELIRAVAQANPHTVVVLSGGGPVLMPWLADVAAVLEAWLPGERFGAAIASVLFGDADPGGRLPLTFPRNDHQGATSTPERYPGVDGTCLYDEGLLVGYRWFDAEEEDPLFPFGYGLSFATFDHGLPDVTDTADQLVIDVPVTNISSRAGVDVVQLYLAGPTAPGRPPRTLVGFAKVRLDPGQRAVARCELRMSDLQVFDEARRTWVVRPGRYRVYVAGSSRAFHSSFDVDVTDAGFGRHTGQLARPGSPV